MTDFELDHAYDTVNVLRAGAIAKIELNRPESINARNAQFGTDLRAAIERVTDDDGVRSVLIAGAGRGFSSGADLKDGFEPDASGRPDVYKALTERYHPVIKGIRFMPKPVVAAVHGPAVGIGLSLALASDLIVAAQDAYFLLAFVNIGLTPDGGSSMFVPNRIGQARAAEMAMLGERVPAPQALEWGLINRVVPAADLETEAVALADRLAQGPTRSYAGTKRQLNAWLYGGIDEQLELEASIQREQAATQDFIEGVMAFLQKRPAAFKGA
jgi:2-(1,2-epoxy-1,2-dihydrophenyl)acetyl-CoA isomerase